MNCKNCKGTNIKSRRNYSHGKKSKTTTILMCKDCGSCDIEATRKRFRR
ncbi:MAG: hypothetical protein ACLFP2_00745 [Candidatus Woesearchaeota archaeon]